jgi:hypothetical protein
VWANPITVKVFTTVAVPTKKLQILREIVVNDPLVPANFKVPSFLTAIVVDMINC